MALGSRPANPRLSVGATWTEPGATASRMVQGVPSWVDVPAGLKSIRTGSLIALVRPTPDSPKLPDPMPVVVRLEREPGIPIDSLSRRALATARSESAMEAMNRKQEKLLSDLILISGGDVLLVERALRQLAVGPDRSTSLKDVIAYIKQNRAPLPGQPEGSGEQAG